jgi:hypothetical protein
MSKGRELSSMVVVLTSLSTEFRFAPELDAAVFNIAGIPYFPPRTPKDREANEKNKKLCYEKIYEAIEQDYSVILLNNTPLTLQVLNELKHKKDSPNASDWLILSFFHNDKTIKDNKIKIADTEYLDPRIILDVKAQDMKILSNYPFIKKVNITYGFQVNFSYLERLLKKVPTRETR